MQTRKHVPSVQQINPSLLSSSLNKFGANPNAVYSAVVVPMHVQLAVSDIGDNVQAAIESILKGKHEGRCISEGFVKPDSVKLLTFSCGLVERGNVAVFQTAFECQVCCPAEGTVLNCVVKDITKAGIRGEIAGEVPSPMVVFVAKDHHHNAAHFNQVAVGDTIAVRVIGARYELNDKFVSVIGELAREGRTPSTTQKRPRLSASQR